MRPLAPPTLRPPAKSAPGSGSSKNVFRRDPFARVPTGPRVPLGAASEVRPAIHPPARVVLPNAPKLSQLAQPKQPAPVSQAPQGMSPANTRSNPPVAPANIFPAMQQGAPLGFRFGRPAIPTEFGAAKPVAPVETIQPAVSPVVPALPASSTAQPIRRTTSALLPPSLPLLHSAVSTAKTIRVEPGDSLWKLAKQHLGRGSLWPRILAINPSVTNPGLLRSGSRISLPQRMPDASARSGSTNTLRTIRVGKGDTLWSLAKSRLGRSSYWPCLAAANPELGDPSRIFVGQVLLVPPGCGGDKAAWNSSAPR